MTSLVTSVFWAKKGRFLLFFVKKRKLIGYYKPSFLTTAGNTTEVEADTTASALLLKHEFLDEGADDVTLATLGEAPR